MTNKTSEHTAAAHDMEQAKAGLAKLPILGPALWLYGRDPQRKFSFIADIDWLLLPPVVLDQCQLFLRDGIPFAFFTWALVDDQVDARLRSGVAKIAPHEWQGGAHVWLIDMVSPFGPADDMLQTLRQSVFAGKAVNAIQPDPERGGAFTVRTWPPLAAAS